MQQHITSLNSRGPTRIEATSAIIWKAAAKAASNIRPFGPESPHAFASSVNLRKRASPPLPNESIGNIVDPALAICFPESQPDLATLMGKIRESIAKKDSNHIESMKGARENQRDTERVKPCDGCRFNRFVLVYLNDTPKCGGVEATVTLSPEEMEIFERDSELLYYAIVDPSPLQFLNH
ncbi:vinorine synthase-like protein [Tanacetum coccineum]